MKQIIVVVIIWYIHVCVNENYLFTRAESKLISFSLKDAYNMTISCTNSSIYIGDVSLVEVRVPCKKTNCSLDDKDIKTISETCNGRNECVLGTKWSTSCIREYVYFNVSYICNATCNFEVSQCGFDTSSTDNPRWTYVSGRNSTMERGGNAQAIPDHTLDTPDGHFMIIKSGGNGDGKMKTETLLHGGQKCLSFWYYCGGFRGSRVNPVKDVFLKILLSGTLRIRVALTADSNWHFYNIAIYILNNEYVSFQAIFGDNNNTLIGIDDVSLSVISNFKGKCDTYVVPEVKTCQSPSGSVHFDACPSFFLKILSFNFTNDVYLNNQRCHNANTITQKITEHCAVSKRWKDCTINLKKIMNNDTCLQLDKTLQIQYICSDASGPSSHEITTHETQSAKYTTMGRQTISTIPQTDDTTMGRETVSTMSQTDDYPDNFRSSTPSSTPVIGIVVGVVLSVVTIAVCLVVAVIYFRRSRYFEKKANSIVVEKNNHSDYTGHQNVAFSPEVNGNTQTDYCEIRTSKHNEQYHDISDTFRPLINTANDDEYSEIANVVNSPNNNPNPSTNYQHQYISLDPNATGFDRSIPQNNLHNESKNNHINSNEMTSFTGGDDYAILDPDDLNESKKDTPKVLPLSDNYVVLDPNETGFNRQESTDTGCNYELATSINPKETSEDPYDVSKDETYDTSCNSRHKEKENNIYSHTVDNVYDTAGNQRKKEESDATYDHFFGQQSEDDYDISKPL